MGQNKERITSRDNSRLAAVRKVRDRKDDSRILVEGRRLVEEALRSNISIENCFVAEGFRSDGLIELIGEETQSIFELSPKLFSSIAETNTPQGILLTAKRPVSDRSTIESKLLSSLLPIVIYLKEINNPSNLGAVMRTAEAAGVAGVVVSTNSADVFSAKSIRASMGSVLRVPVWEDAEFDEVLLFAGEKELKVTASDVSAAKSYADIDFTVPRMIIFGSEAHGLDQSELERICEKVFIPMENNVESLNLAVSAGIILFEAKQQISSTIDV